MDRLIIIKESDLKSLIQEAVTNAVDDITKKIASRAARRYNNEIFRRSAPIMESGCGSSSRNSGGCGGSDDDDYGYGGCGSAIPSYGGCGSSIPSRSSGGCGGGYESGGC